MDRNRVNDSSVTFTNKGYCHDEMDGTCRVLNASRLCNENRTRCERNERVLETDRANHAKAASSRRIIDGIRTMAEEELAAEGRCQLRLQSERRKTTNNVNICIFIFAVILVLSPIAISVYVLLKHQENVQSSRGNNSQGPSMSPSMQQHYGEYTEIQNLIQKVKLLNQKYQDLQTGLVKSHNVSSKDSLRNDRKSRKNSTNENSDKVMIEKLRKQFNNKGASIRRMCMYKAVELTSKISSLEGVANDCTFEMENDTKVDSVKSRQRVEITEDKNTSVQIRGVICCPEHEFPTNASNAVLEVSETSSNRTYACHCVRGQICRICYWICGVNARYQDI